MYTEKSGSYGKLGHRKPAFLFGGLIIAITAVASFLYGDEGAPQAAAGTQGSPSIETLTAAELATTDLGLISPSKWEDLPTLPLRKEEDGSLRGTLRVDYARNLLTIGGKTQALWLRSYNGKLTGPTIEVRAGDTLKIDLKNDLPDEGHKCEEMVMEEGKCEHPKHGFNTTNLHTHGLHISPKGNSDNVLLKVCPGKQFGYKFEILPAGAPGHGAVKHYPGTFWYHAHHHGSTAIQLASGMAGALIVRGEIDEVPEIKAARERIFVFQQLAYDERGKVEDFSTLANNWKNLKRHTVINGRVKPLISMRPNQVERWRFIDSGIFEDLPIIIRPAEEGSSSFRMYRIAVDGITRPKPELTGDVELAPGYRVDLLVKAPTQPGTYYLYKKKSIYSLSGKNPPPNVDNPQILAQIQVVGPVCTDATPTCATKIPETLPAPVQMLPDIKESEVIQERAVLFDVKNPHKHLYTINGKCYEGKVPIFNDELPKVGNVEEWTVENVTDQVHPFHIHVNAFQMVREGKPAEWRDTILVPPGKSVKFRTRFERFDGDFVLHCHILTHEDSGMMALVRVKPKAP